MSDHHAQERELQEFRLDDTVILSALELEQALAEMAELEEREDRLNAERHEAMMARFDSMTEAEARKACGVA